jgi:hypothetical protein
MTVSTSRASYEDCFHLLDRAMDSPAGIRHSCPTSGAAHHLRVRLNYARVLSRNEHSSLAPDDPRLGTSPYDALSLPQPRLIEGKWWVYIIPRALPGETEELPVTCENIHDLSPIDNYSENGVRRRRTP